FSFEEAAVARRLAELHQAGCTLQTIERRLDDLRRLRPDVERPLADPTLIVEGRRLLLRREDDVAEPHGQLLLEFEQADDDSSDPPAIVALTDFDAGADGDDDHGEHVAQVRYVERLWNDAIVCEDRGDYVQAIGIYRAVLMAGLGTAEVQFALAEALYREGELEAARERYYVALEMDEEFVEARANLGCVLAEMGDYELAAATFQGALRRHPDFADVHFHLADTCERLGDALQAAEHYRVFLALAPDSPWASTARDRLASPDRLQVVSANDSIS
ncbi:MAG: tetratricopeptide repeat protein, partial [Planctomycetales bacterium]|nr:tetratricopeptide repeat protein [Planctomycetales bacterium]